MKHFRKHRKFRLYGKRLTRNNVYVGAYIFWGSNHFGPELLFQVQSFNETTMTYKRLARKRGPVISRQESTERWGFIEVEPWLIADPKEIPKYFPRYMP